MLGTPKIKKTMACVFLFQSAGTTGWGNISRVPSISWAIENTTRISIRKNDFTKKNFQRLCSPKSRTSSSITYPYEMQCFKYVAVSGCCHFHGSSSCKFIAPTYRIDPAKAAWSQRHNSSRDLNPPNTCKLMAVTTGSWGKASCFSPT